MKHLELSGHGRSAARRRILGLAVLAAASLCLVGCAGSSHPRAATGAASATPQTGTAASVTGTPAQPPGALPSGTAAATTSATTKPAGTASSDGQSSVSSGSPCDQQVLLSYIRTQATNLPTGVEQVKIYNCVKGFARLYAVPNLNASGARPDGNEFFLQYTAGQWRVLASGNSLDCGDNNPSVTEACAAFA